ncbi:hypothetical protein [Aquimarina longa]|uniref:hypothetical protein n=1 Tax=Aquimarina longa TaxID=1080221 RepID=UPI00078453E2|nr:hypothetical protein [Aquimarina longa]
MKTQHLIFMGFFSIFMATSCSNDLVEEVSSVPDKEVIENNQPFFEDYSHLASTSKRLTFLPDKVSFTAPGLYPEGVEFDFRRNRFYVSSFTQGTIGIVTNEGEYVPFIEDEILTATVGVHIDNIRDRIYVTIGSFFQNIAGVAGYDLKTGKRILYVDLVGLIPNTNPFPNDLITDFEGNIYVTDTGTSTLYKINTEGEASIFLQDEKLKPSVGFGINGITYHPFGFLLVASSDAKIFRVPINKPESFTAIDLPVGGLDGLQIIDFRTIHAVSNFANVIEYKSNDAWRTIELGSSYTVQGDFPTTLANAYFKTTYVINSSLDDLFRGANPPVETFTIEKVVF